MAANCDDSERSSGSPTRLSRNRAWRNPTAVVLFLVVAVLAGGSDLGSKQIVFTRLMQDETIPPRVEKVLDDHFGTTRPPDATPQTTRQILQYLHITHNVCFGLRFTLSTNPGVVFGIRWFPPPVVNAITIGMMLFVIGFFLLSEKRHYWLHAALALLLGGAFGNLYDRMYSKVSLPNLPPIRYHVRDFIDCSELGYRWVFNLSDAWLVIGAGMILAYWLWTSRKARQAEASRKK